MILNALIGTDLRLILPRAQTVPPTTSSDYCPHILLIKCSLIAVVAFAHLLPNFFL